MMLSQVGEEKCHSTLVDLVFCSENDDYVNHDKSSSINNHNLAKTSSTGTKRKCHNGTDDNYPGDESSQKLLRTLRGKFALSKHFQEVHILRSMYFFLFFHLPFSFLSSLHFTFPLLYLFKLKFLISLNFK